MEEERPKVTNVPAGKASDFCLYDFEPPRGMPCLDIDPFEPDFLADPARGHEELRQAGDIVWLSRYNVAAVARFEVVSAVLDDWKTFSSARGVGMEDFERHGRFRLPSVILETDPPVHDTARSILTRAMSPAWLRQIKADIEVQADILVADLLERGNVDGITDIAQAFPMLVFPELVGIPVEGRERLLPHADLLFNSFGPRNELFRASLEGAASEFVESLGHLDRLAPEGLGTRVHKEAKAAGLEAETAAQLVRALLQAGFDTTINALGAALFCLASHPRQWALLREKPELAGGAIEEAVRLESPVQTFFRTVTTETQFSGARLVPGHKILMFLGAANRDPWKFANPEQYDIRRPVGGHVGFGAGVHRCVGRMLARLEAEAILVALIRNVRRLKLAGAPTRRLNNTVRGFSSLPLQLVV